MALQDILAAITAQADKQIEQARAVHQKELSTMREQSEQQSAKRKQEIVVSKKQKQDMLTAKAHTHASVHKRNSALRKKKELLDTLYDKVIAQMCTLSEKDVEPLLRAWVKSINDKGDIFPSASHEALLKKICPNEQFAIQKSTNAKGGFLFVSKTREQDFTFEHLVEHVLRPKTALETSHVLFR